MCGFYNINREIVCCNTSSLLIFSASFCTKECLNNRLFLAKMFGYQKLMFVPALFSLHLYRNFIFDIKVRIFVLALRDCFKITYLF